MVPAAAPVNGPPEGDIVNARRRSGFVGDAALAEETAKRRRSQRMRWTASSVN